MMFKVGSIYKNHNMMFKIGSVYKHNSCLDICFKIQEIKEKEIKIIRVLRSYLHGFASLYIADLFNIKTVDVDESFDLGLNALLSGLGLD